jgi:glycine C-acetyltransferase
MATIDAIYKRDLNQLERGGFTWKPRLLSGQQAAIAVIDGSEVVNLASNNYLGLSNDPRVKKAMKDAVDRYGGGAVAARPIMTMDVHRELERKTAGFKNAESAIVFQSGYVTNVAAIQTLMGEHDVIISDELNHGSIIDGCRLSKAEVRVYPHGDISALAELASDREGFERGMIVTDAVFSMDGDIAPLPEIVNIAKRYGYLTMVDDAHATGVLGKHGRGSMECFDLHGQVDVQMGTFSKALGSVGGYVAGSRTLVELLRQKARSYLLSTALPPSDMAGAIAAISILQEAPEVITTLWDNVRYFREGLRDLGFDTGQSETPIVPVIVGRSHDAVQLSERLFANGVYAVAIVYPLVAKGNARIRTIVTAMHQRRDLDFALQACARCGRELGLI